MLHIITPVKDSIPSTLQTLRALAGSDIPEEHRFTVYNDFSTPENTQRLLEETETLGMELVNLADLTEHPSPNYLFVLRREQRLCLEEGADLLIVESDVTVRPDTLRRLTEAARQRPDSGIAAAVTVDEAGGINNPYLYARGNEAEGVLDTRKHLSFCCTLLTRRLLHSFDFALLDDSKNWFDVTISHASLEAGLHNYLLTSLPVLHRPHQSRPWKQLKYENPLKYYWLKLTKGLDKI
ncbi:MAG: glycosyltransferase family 2 protein [Alloprevotella sp.]|nr:glycosyltransferase family 2 protein [Alloprevotella sp.]